MNAEIRPQQFRYGRVLVGIRVVLFALGAALVGVAFSDAQITGGPDFGLTEMILLACGALNVTASVVSANVLLAWVMCEVAVVVTLGAAEVALRATLSQRYYSPFQLNERYLYNLVPGARREYRQLLVNGASLTYTVNSRGFRGEEFATAAAAPRVVIYGDSFIHAEYTALEHTLAEQLEAQLAAKLSRPVEVINAGVAGYGPDQVLRRLEDELGWLQPDLLIVAVFAGNDFGDLLRNKIYRLGPDGALEGTHYTFSNEIVRNAALENSEFLLRKIGQEAKAALQSRLRDAADVLPDPTGLTEERLQQHLQEYQEYVLDHDNEIRELRSDPYSADISLLPDSLSAKYKLALMDVVIAQIGKAAAEHRVPLLLVAIPHPMDVMGGDHESGAVDKARYPAYLSSRLTDSVQAIAERHGIDVVNLFPPFSSSVDPAALYLRGGDDHWNDAGQACAAEIIAATVLEHAHGWLDSDGGAEHDVQPPGVRGGAAPMRSSGGSASALRCDGAYRNARG